MNQPPGGGYPPGPFQPGAPQQPFASQMHGPGPVAEPSRGAPQAQNRGLRGTQLMAAAPCPPHQPRRR